MVVVGVRIQDTDDAELCGICRTCAVVLTALEPDNDIDIDVLAAQVSDNVEDLRAFDVDGIPAKCPWSGGNERVGAFLQPAQKEAVVFVDERKAAVLEEAEIEQEEAATELRAGFDEGTLVGSFVGDVVNEVEHGTGSVVVYSLELREELL